MKISVIMPVYNGEKWLKRSIKSIISNDADIELLLIDDGSTDQSVEICSDYAKKNRNIVLLKNDSKGTCSARNKGLKSATGDIVTFCDQDDFFEPGALETVAEEFAKNDVGMIVSAFNSGSENNKTYRGFKESFCKSAYDFIPLVINDLRVAGSVWSKFYRKSIVGDTLFDEDLSYAEDVTFVSTMLYKHKEVECMFLNKALYMYYDENPENLTNNLDKRFNEKGKLKYNICFERIRENCPDDQMIADEVGYKIVWYSIDALRSCHPEGLRRELLKKDIRDNLKYFYHLFGKYGFVADVKRFVCVVIELAK